MILFQSSLPWSKLKAFRNPYFNWLRSNNVYLNQTKFKTDTLVACGILLGAHPSYLRRDEAEQELHQSLKLQDQEIPFQLSSRTISVPIKEGAPEKYTFQAVVVETSSSTAASLRERFYQLENPLMAQATHPYTGKYPFVPLLPSKEWTIQKILRLAKLHESIISDLKPIFLANLSNIHTKINDTGETLLQGFYGMTNKATTETPSATQKPLLHSIHNTGQATVKVALTTTKNYEEAVTQLSAIHSILTANIPPAYHSKVFIGNTTASITGRQIDSISSCNYSTYADQLLSTFNPQDGEDPPTIPAYKRNRLSSITYAAATKQNTAIDPPSSSSHPTTASSLTSLTIDELYDKMKHHIQKEYGDNPGVKIDVLEEQIKSSSHDIKLLKEQIDSTTASLNTRMDTLATTIDKQNAIILAMQRDFQATMQDITKQLTRLPPQGLSQPTNSSPNSPGTSTITPNTSTSKHRSWSDLIS
jgi:hypothetical protein